MISTPIWPIDNNRPLRSGGGGSPRPWMAWQNSGCLGCGLYWYTDLAAAEAVAGASGKPILSLHLLGQLDQELSSQQPILPRHAVSQPPGAGRNAQRLHPPLEIRTPRAGDHHRLRRWPKIVRTITGNSIHYVLDASGRVIDAIPVCTQQPFVSRSRMRHGRLSLRSCTSDLQHKSSCRRGIGGKSP